MTRVAYVTITERLSHAHDCYTILISNVVAVVHGDGLRLYLQTAASNGPIYHSPDYTWVWGATVEWYWQGNTEELRKNPVSCHFVHHKSDRTDASANPGLRDERPATNRLNHGTASKRSSPDPTGAKDHFPECYVCNEGLPSLPMLNFHVPGLRL
jgi:hypothetical protein